MPTYISLLNLTQKGIRFSGGSEAGYGCQRKTAGGMKGGALCGAL